MSDCISENAAANSEKFLVAQLGARRHYAVPRILEASGQLGVLYTDLSGGASLFRGLRVVPPGFRPAIVQRIIDRTPTKIPERKVRHLPWLALRYHARLRRARDEAEKYAAYVWVAKQFNNSILKRGFGDVSAVYVFNAAGREILERARELGMRTILEQTIAPLETELALLAEEHVRFPEWGGPPKRTPAHEEFMARNRAEWSVADAILAGSEFVRSALKECGVPVGRCWVVPYGYDIAEGMTGVDAVAGMHAARSGPLRVLCAGAVSLRKGHQYAVEAAKRLKRVAVFRFVGPIQVKREVVDAIARIVELVGPVPRSAMPYHYKWADVLLLPSLCEGSATVTYEAMAWGLPVICTPNTGSVVRSGLDGYIVPIRDVDAIAASIESLCHDRRLLAEMRGSAVRRARGYTVEGYGRRLVDVLSQSRARSGWAS